MQYKRCLYFIALIPDAKIREQVKRFKADFARSFNAPYGLKVIPHITLIDPFSLPQFFHQVIEEWFAQVDTRVPPFHIDLDGFGCFPRKNHPVIYVKPGNNDLLHTLRITLLRQFNTKFPYLKSKNMATDFTAHMTVAYRDLTWEDFEKAWEVYEFKPIKALFDVKEVCLLQHDTKQWNIIRTHGLGNLANG